MFKNLTRCGATCHLQGNSYENGIYCYNTFCNALLFVEQLAIHKVTAMKIAFIVVTHLTEPYSLWQQLATHKVIAMKMAFSMFIVITHIAEPTGNSNYANC